MICEKQNQVKWGDAFLKVMSNDLQKAFPGVSGFSVENLNIFVIGIIFLYE